MPHSTLVPINHEYFTTDLVYATTHNFLERAIYKELGITQCQVHQDLYAYLLKTVPLLQKHNLKLCIFDGYRPLAAQQAMWDILPDDRYVANPATGSKHNRGTAVDCYLTTMDGTPLVFPTTPDAYDPIIEKDPVLRMAYLEKASHHYICTPEEKTLCENRALLKSIMLDAGFIALDEEWWHYEIPNAANYPLI